MSSRYSEIMSCDGGRTTGSMRHISSKLPVSTNPPGHAYWNGKSRKGCMRRYKEVTANIKVGEVGSAGKGRILTSVPGTWVPLTDGRALAEKNGILRKLFKIFDYVAGDRSPPPAPKHTTAASNRPKAVKPPAQPRKAVNQNHGQNNNHHLNQSPCGPALPCVALR